MNQQTASECNEIASVKEQMLTEYESALDKMNSASGRKEIIYWAHRATELKQVMESRASEVSLTKSLYQAGYSGIG